MFGNIHRILDKLQNDLLSLITKQQMIPEDEQFSAPLTLCVSSSPAVQPGPEIGVQLPSSPAWWRLGKKEGLEEASVRPCQRRWFSLLSRWGIQGVKAPAPEETWSSQKEWTVECDHSTACRLRFGGGAPRKRMSPGLWNTCLPLQGSSQ